MKAPFTNSLSGDHMARKVRSMADAFEAEDVASMCGISLDEVLRILGGQRKKWWLRCNRSGRVWHKATWRGCYWLVCFYGLVDWDWGNGGSVGDGVQP